MKCSNLLSRHFKQVSGAHLLTHFVFVDPQSARNDDRCRKTHSGQHVPIHHLFLGRPGRRVHYTAVYWLHTQTAQHTVQFPGTFCAFMSLEASTLTQILNCTHVFRLMVRASLVIAMSTKVVISKFKFAACPTLHLKNDQQDFLLHIIFCEKNSNFINSTGIIMTHDSRSEYKYKHEQTRNREDQQTNNRVAQK